MGDGVPEDVLRSLPSVDRVLNASGLESARSELTHEVLVRLVRTVLEHERQARAAGSTPRKPEDLVTTIDLAAAALLAAGPAVINASGVILHTNLGRAPLSAEAVAAMQMVAGYTDLELDLRTGERGSRQTRIADLLKALTGAGAALVVGSNAAAVLLSLTALCRGRDVLVSRGQAVEIGGGFRIPAILRQSGARLLEVGTTNRTRLADFAEAITPRTAAILHVHASNFRIIGFTESPVLDGLARLAHERGLLLLVDNGSGSLLDTSRFGLGREPMPQEALEAGADVVAFSGDKLIGGPQAGILVGREEPIRRLSRHPLTRAVRPDKLTLAGLEATLQAYVRGDAVQTLPVWRMIAQTPDEIAGRVRGFREQALALDVRLEVQPGESTVGGGSLPGEVLATTLLVAPRGMSAAALRSGATPVIGRTRGGRVVLDLRTVAPDQEAALLAALSAVNSRPA